MIPVSLLLLLMLLLGGFYSLSSLSGATEWMTHTDEVRVALGGLHSTLLDAEAGTRGFLITGERAFLEPADRGLSAWHAQFDRLRTLLADNPDQQQRLRELEQLVRMRFENLVRARSAHDAGRA